MRILFIASAVIVFLGSVPRFAYGQEPVPSGLAVGEGQLPPADDRNIFIELMVVAIPTEKAVPLVIELNGESTRKAAVGKVLEAIKSGGASVIGWPVVITRSGQRGFVESTKEIRFATHYEAGGVAIYTYSTDGKYKRPDIIPQDGDFDGIATDFDMRKTGVTLSAEPHIAEDGKTLNMYFEIERTRLVGMKKVSVEKEKSKEKVSVEQPEFDVFHQNATLKVESGDQKLVGIFPTTEPADHLELFLLRAEIRKP